mgnify:CR=1 FL=1
MTGKIHIMMPCILVALLVQCKKPAERTCFKGKGEASTRTVQLNAKNDSLRLFDDLDYTIVPDSSNRIVLIGGAHLLQHVQIEESDKQLTITNNNKCGFLRDLSSRIKVELHIESPPYIYYEGSEGLTNQDTLKSGELRLVIRDGAGDVELTVQNSYMSALVTHGFGNYTLKGQTIQAYFNNKTNSFGDTRDLEVSSQILVKSQTQGNMVVNADGAQLQAEIYERGNIMYTGTPFSVDLTKEGAGDLIPLSE